MPGRDDSFSASQILLDKLVEIRENDGTKNPEQLIAELKAMSAILVANEVRNMADAMERLTQQIERIAEL